MEAMPELLMRRSTGYSEFASGLVSCTKPLYQYTALSGQAPPTSSHNRMTLSKDKNILGSTCLLISQNQEAIRDPVSEKGTLILQIRVKESIDQVNDQWETQAGHGMEMISLTIKVSDTCRKLTHCL